MCGIVGVLGKDSIRQQDVQSVEDAVRSLALRGPDGEGIHAGSGFCFGHRRLAILDPEAGKQPWVDDASGVVLTYNGELYNFRELRDRLQSKGHRFVTTCDTEVLVKAYLEWGRDCLQFFNGIYAFALFDPREDALWLVRDRLGVKPLYYHFDGKQLRFASTLKALFEFPEIERVVDSAALMHYLRTIRTTLGNKTLVRNVLSLNPGEELWWKRSGQWATRSYWQLQMIPESEKTGHTFASAVEETRSRVDDAVKEQLISDVPLGGFLSGGIDSSILTSAALSGGSKQFGTYSVGYSQDGYNEWEFVRQAADYYDVPNKEIQLEGDDYLSDWEWMIGEKGLPLSTPNEVPIWHLAKSFRSRFCVALTGEGADEVFGGYVGPTFCAVDYDRSRGRGGSIDETALHRFYGKSRFESRLAHFFQVNSWLPEEKLNGLLKPQWMSQEKGGPVELFYRDLFNKSDHCSTFDAYLRVHLQVNLEGLLSRLDTSTMAASVEGRVPFTDHRLVEWVYSLPDRFKMDLRPELDWEAVRQKNSFEMNQDRDVESKRLLRSAFKDRVSPSIANRAKMSFPVPFTDWFSTLLAEPFRQYVNESVAIESLVSKQVQSSLLNNRSPDPMLAWPLMNLGIWQKQFGVRF